MVTLGNGTVTAEINETGAELRTLNKNGKNYMWQGIPEIWSGVAPLLFPICGGLRDDKFVYKNREYILNKHGYARFMRFETEQLDEGSVTFLHRSNSETLKCYPFEYELRVTYNLTQSGIRVTYAVDNETDGYMYFSIGSHEAYATPTGIEDYDIIFPEKETLSSVMLDGNVLQKNAIPIIKNSNVLPLYDKYFLIDALVFKDIRSREVTLRNRKTGAYVNVKFDGKPYFLIWHKHTAPYICLEPWAGISDCQDTDYDITKKEGIIKLEKNGRYEISHEITIGEE